MAVFSRPEPTTGPPSCRISGRSGEPLMMNGDLITAADFNNMWRDVNTVTPQLGEIKQEVHSCGYCHGKTTNDMRGNCAACGAPRKEIALEPFAGQGIPYGKPITHESPLVLDESAFPSVIAW